MTLRLSDEQSQAVAASSLPLEIFDRQTHRTYYLISAEQYERTKAEAEEIDASFYEFTDIEMLGENA